MDILEAIRTLNRVSSGQITEISDSSQKLRKQYIEAQKSIEDMNSYGILETNDARKVAIAALDLLNVNLGEEFAYLPSLTLNNLARIMPEALIGLYDRLLESGLIKRSGLLFKAADPATRDQLLTIAQEVPWRFRERKYKRVDILCALAWIGDATVQAHFAQWIKNPPVWTKSPPLNLTRIPWVAGWELTTEEKRRDLYFRENYGLVPTNLKIPDGPVRVIVQSNERCGWCERTLTILFDLNIHDARLAFLWPGGERLCIATCINCSMQRAWMSERVFVDIDGNGLVRWSLENGPVPPNLRVNAIGEESFALQEHLLVLGAARRTPYDSQGDHLGGCPEWVQDSDYPSCPSCNQTMIFVGQVDPDAPYLEGTIYAFICKECGKSTIGYQQT